MFGVAGGANSVLGADIEPALGKIERAKQQRQLWADRHLIQSLRVPEDPNSDWRLEPARRKHMLDQAYGRDSDDQPDVFVRMLDPKNCHGTHKHRFDENGKGRGLEGRRDNTDYEDAIAGHATITRSLVPEFDAPNRPLCSWEQDKLRSDATLASLLGASPGDFEAAQCVLKNIGAAFLGWCSDAPPGRFRLPSEEEAQEAGLAVRWAAYRAAVWWYS